MKKFIQGDDSNHWGRKNGKRSLKKNDSKRSTLRIYKYIFRTTIHTSINCSMLNKYFIKFQKI